MSRTEPGRTLRWSPDAEWVSLPDGFLWGVATAAHQVEGGNERNDWHQAELAGRLPAAGRACGHWERFGEDFDLAKAWHHTAHRFSLEWSRVQPEPDRWDSAALDHYSRVVDALRERDIEPLLTLHHFTNPTWFAAEGGWLSRDAPLRFRDFVERVVERLGDRVRWWLTINEPTVWAKHAFVMGDWPPFLRGRWLRAGKAIGAMMRAHVAAYHAIHAEVRDARVGFAHSAPNVVPCRPGNPLDRVGCFVRDYLLNEAPFRMIGAASPSPPIDFIGVNYYARTIVRWGWGGGGPLFGAECKADHHHGPRGWSEMGWEIHPAGLHEVLRRFSSYGLPMVVTENGLATDDEELRCVVLADHLAALTRSSEEGLDVRGYCCWTLVDNYEWALGMRPRFGLAALDPTTLERIPRRAAELYAAVCARNAAPRTGSSALIPELGDRAE